MTPEPKQVVIDKCAFQGTNDDRLCSFAMNHVLVLPHDLYGEIVTSKKLHERETHLQRFRNAMLSNAHWGRSLRSMVEWEAKTLQPYGPLVDWDETRKMRDRLARGDAYSPEFASDAAVGNLDSARITLGKCAMVCQEVAPHILACAGARRHELEPRARRWERLQFLIDRIDEPDALNIHAIAVSQCREGIRHPDRFCLSRDWVSWQHVRLTTVLLLEYSFLKKGRGGGTEQENAEHDLYDVHYAVLLSRADGVITWDKQLVEPLARAAFPENDVFSSLEEVPESYRCD